ncbi:MAG TPA: hypothetical protein VN041_16490 [Microbacterium sp.]|jgi:hypothetical protein|uniref:hypothetical protein n=1 Tax=Microbacterium TaxID=33882 RepID=UPI000A99B084|nr:hypothetical protein [Microbacterium sp. 69-10]HWU30681.1 hypothetical protein [Microbacterium sp.]
MSASEQSEKQSSAQHITTKTGRILRVTDEQLAAAAAAKAAASAIPDPARRKDVLFRVRREEGHELSSWWMIGAFLLTASIVVALLSGVPGGA